MGARGPKVLIEFKAGRMDYDGKMVTPDRRKGLVRVVEEAPGMKQFQWCDPDTKNAIENFYIFPDESKFEKVKQSSDRVYVLMNMPAKKYNFYWMQEDEPEKDAERCKKLHNILNNIKDASTPAPGAETPSASGAASSVGTPASSTNPQMAQQQAMMDALLAMQEGMGRPKPKKPESPDLPQTIK